MARQLNERETFASVLATLILQRSTASRSGNISRSSLLASVPAGEMASVRRGLDALIDHGMLGLNGDAIGFTQKGTVFLAYAASVQENSSMPEVVINNHRALTPMLAALERDERLAPPMSPEDMRTLPGRLEEYRNRTQDRFWNVWTVLLAMVFALAVIALAVE